MNIIDYGLAAIVLLSLWSGFRRGFVIGALELVSWLGSLVLAFYGYKYLAVLFEKGIPSLGVWTMPLAFIATLILARILFSYITNLVFRHTSADVHVNPANKALGLVPGLVNGLIYATLIAALLLAVPISDGLSAHTRESKYAGRLASNVEWLDQQLSPIFDEAVNRTMNKLTVRPESNKSVNLPFTVANPKVRPDLEAEMLKMVNEERRKAGLQPLKADPELTTVARSHSRDMFARGYFSHLTPEGKTPSDRIRAAGVRFLTAGENLALGQTLSICHTGLMNSPGHRANILHKSYGRLGIGILDGGIHGLMVTQNFRN